MENKMVFVPMDLKELVTKVYLVVVWNEKERRADQLVSVHLTDKDAEDFVKESKKWSEGFLNLRIFPVAVGRSLGNHEDPFQGDWPLRDN